MNQKTKIKIPDATPDASWTDQPTQLALHPKVAAGVLGSNVTVLTIYSLDHWVHLNPPSYVAAAILGIVTFACGYLTPSR